MAAFLIEAAHEIGVVTELRAPHPREMLKKQLSLQEMLQRRVALTVALVAGCLRLQYPTVNARTPLAGFTSDVEKTAFNESHAHVAFRRAKEKGEKKILPRRYLTTIL